MKLANGVQLINGALEDEWGRRLGPCANPACDRLVKVGTLYCCGGCSNAHAAHAEPHEGGDMFSHTDSCNARHTERQGALRAANDALPETFMNSSGEYDEMPF